MTERKVRLCVKLFDFFVGEYSSVWPEICRVLSWIRWRFLRRVSGKNYFGRIFQKFSRKPRLSSTKTCEISHYILRFLFCVRIALKKLTQVLSYVVCTQVRRHVHKRITKRRYGEEKPGRFVSGKPVLFSLGLGLTTPYSLGVLVWNFYHTFVTVSIEFWPRLESPDSSHKIDNKFFIDHCQGWEEGSSVCETSWFFSWVNTPPFDLKFDAFCPEFSVDSYVEFLEKTILGEFFRNFHANQGYPLPKLVKFRPPFCSFYSASVLHRKNSHKYFHMLFAPR